MYTEVMILDYHARIVVIGIQAFAEHVLGDCCKLKKSSEEQ